MISFPVNTLFLLLDSPMAQPKQSTDRKSSEISLGKSRKAVSSLALPDKTMGGIFPYVFLLQNLKNICFSCDFRYKGKNHIKAQ